MACETCGCNDRTIMIPMKPGPDGKPWEYCRRCYEDGRRPFKLGMFKKPTEISDPHLADALVSASKRTPGLIQMDSAKDDVGDFSRTPKRQRRRAG